MKKRRVICPAGRRRSIGLCVAFLFAGLAASCSGGGAGNFGKDCQEDIVFDNVLESDCAPPCWRGVVPGATTKDEAIKLLGHEAEVDFSSAWAISWGRCCAEHWTARQAQLQLDPADGVVTSITLGDPARGYTLGDAVRDYGPPSSVQRSFFGPDSNLGQIYLVYPEKGVALATGLVPVTSDPWQQRSAKERVYEWSYFAPRGSGGMVTESGIIFGCGTSSDCLSDWAGFGK